MKQCPACHAACFDDARLCYECLYEFAAHESRRPSPSDNQLEDFLCIDIDEPKLVLPKINAQTDRIRSNEECKSEEPRMKERGIEECKTEKRRMEEHGIEKCKTEERRMEEHGIEQSKMEKPRAEECKIEEHAMDEHIAEEREKPSKAAQDNAPYGKHAHSTTGKELRIDKSDHIELPTDNLPAGKPTSGNLPTSELSSANLPTSEFSSNNLPTRELSSGNLPTSEFSSGNLPFDNPWDNNHSAQEKYSWEAAIVTGKPALRIEIPYEIIVACMTRQGSLETR